MKGLRWYDRTPSIISKESLNIADEARPPKIQGKLVANKYDSNNLIIAVLLTIISSSYTPYSMNFLYFDSKSGGLLITWNFSSSLRSYSLLNHTFKPLIQMITLKGLHSYFHRERPLSENITKVILPFLKAFSEAYQDKLLAGQLITSERTFQSWILRIIKWDLYNF